MSKDPKDVVIVGAARTPFGKLGGSLKPFQAPELGGMAIKEALKRSGIAGSEVSETIYGCVIPAGLGQIPGRQAMWKAGIPLDRPALTINKVCGSALKAVTLGVQTIKAGDNTVVVAGGMESMSNAPYLSQDIRWGHRMYDFKMVHAMVQDGLWCPQYNVHMACHGGEVALEHGISREMQDEWAQRSQEKWQQAEEKHAFDDERFAVEIKDRKGRVTVFDKDEQPRPESTLEGLKKLPALFTDVAPKSTVTAGNAPGTNDGASAVVICTREYADAHGLKPLAVIRGYAQAATDSKQIATIPGVAIQKLMEKYNVGLDTFDVMEINEAFAAVTLVSGISILGMSWDELDKKCNVNGGAVAVGHPIGATGARILMTMIWELKRRGQKNGVAALCSGMAQGDACWIEVED